MNHGAAATAGGAAIVAPVVGSGERGCVDGGTALVEDAASPPLAYAWWSCSTSLGSTGAAATGPPRFAGNAGARAGRSWSPTAPFGAAKRGDSAVEALRK